MDIGILIARIIHVVGAVIWVGSMFFLAVFLGPAIEEMGPEGGKLMGALARRNWPVFVPIVAILTMLAGLYLYWRASSGFDPGYMRSGPGMTFGVGAAAAILAYIIGMAVTRPAMMNAMKMSQQMATASEAERQQLGESIARNRERASAGGKFVITLLLIAAVAMSVARYVQ
jgi:uncharacterized membrane protein